MRSDIPQGLIGTERFSARRSRTVLVAIVAFCLGFVPRAFTIGFPASFVVLGGGLAAGWAGYRRAGLVTGWVLACASLLGFFGYENIFELSSLTAQERFVTLLEPEFLIMVAVLSIVLGTLPCLFGYLLRWYVSSRNSELSISDRSWTVRDVVRASKYVLAGLVMVIAWLLYVDAPFYPSWPTVGNVPVNPELVVPGLLSVAVLVDTNDDEMTIGSILLGVLAFLTLTVVGRSMYVLYAIQTGGVFTGGLLSIALGIALGVATITVDIVWFGENHGVFTPDGGDDLVSE